MELRPSWRASHTRAHANTPPHACSQKESAEAERSGVPSLVEKQELHLSIERTLLRPKSKEKVVGEKLSEAPKSSCSWEKFGQSSLEAEGWGARVGAGPKGRGTSYYRGAKGMKASHPLRLTHSTSKRSPLVSTRSGQGPEGGGVGTGSGCLSVGLASEHPERTAEARAGGSAGAATGGVLCSARLAACDCGCECVASPFIALWLAPRQITPVPG